MANYRVFVTRHFIDVCHFDIEAPTVKKAVGAAKKAAYVLRGAELSAAVATDNGWIPDDGIEIDEIGYPNPEVYQMRLFQEDRKKGVKVWVDGFSDGKVTERAESAYRRVHGIPTL